MNLGCTSSANMYVVPESHPPRTLEIGEMISAINNTPHSGAIFSRDRAERAVQACFRHSGRRYTISRSAENVDAFIGTPTTDMSFICQMATVRRPYILDAPNNATQYVAKMSSGRKFFGRLVEYRRFVSRLVSTNMSPTQGLAIHEIGSRAQSPSLLFHVTRPYLALFVYYTRFVTRPYFGWTLDLALQR